MPSTCSGKFSIAPQRRSRLRCGRRGGPDGDPAGVHADHARDQDSCPRASNPPRHLRRSREGRRQKDKEKPDEATRRTDADGPEDEGGTACNQESLPKHATHVATPTPPNGKTSEQNALSSLLKVPRKAPAEFEPLQEPPARSDE